MTSSHFTTLETGQIAEVVSMLEPFVDVRIYILLASSWLALHLNFWSDNL